MVVAAVGTEPPVLSAAVVAAERACLVPARMELPAQTLWAAGAVVAQAVISVLLLLPMLAVLAACTVAAGAVQMTTVRLEALAPRVPSAFFGAQVAPFHQLT